MSLDLTGTLFHYRGRLKHYLRRSVSRYAENVSVVMALGKHSDAAVEDAFRESYNAITSQHPVFGAHSGVSVEDWYSLVVRDVLTARLPEVPRELQTDAALASISGDMFSTFAGVEPYELFEDTSAVLRALKARGYKLVALSNADERYHGVLEQLDISQCFDEVCLSHAYGVEKPDPAFFHAMMEVCGISDPRECLHVGDSYQKDYLVAQSLGMHAAFMIRYDRGREEYSHLLVNNPYVVSGMDELLEKLPMVAD